jgi:dynamin 1-like protein
LANQISLSMAREVDPDGERTIAVITKIDLMDEGTDAIEMLKGTGYNLKHGYFGVKCRS